MLFLNVLKYYEVLKDCWTPIQSAQGGNMAIFISLCVKDLLPCKWVPEPEEETDFIKRLNTRKDYRDVISIR